MVFNPVSILKRLNPAGSVRGYPDGFRDCSKKKLLQRQIQALTLEPAVWRRLAPSLWVSSVQEPEGGGVGGEDKSRVEG